jgi:2-oxoglutarate ferredoxin oxidoreductase subunit alpha
MREFIDGNEAIARGAIRAGCDFFAGYPITPATSILLHLSQALPKTGGIAIQGEDEIASIGFCIGAALAGKRAMTATSGPGISLYSESIGAAIMAEIPLVIVDVQRMGPATGAPTLGSYGDVLFVRWGHSGGFPIIALSPVDVADCYHLTIRAFELAARFRLPVFILTDKETGLTKATVDTTTWQHAGGPSSPPSINDIELPHLNLFEGPNLVRLTTSSHTTDGYLTKDADAICVHNQHLIDKISQYIHHITLVDYNPQPGADTLIISYGITASAVRQAVHDHRTAGKLISSLVIYTLWPVPELEIRNALDCASRVIIPELNWGLYRREIERFARPDQQLVSINHNDGSLISPLEILDLL